MRIRVSLLGEIVTMAFETLRTQRLRSALTILGIVIGITSIVGMTSIIRGFDESLRESILEMGPNTIVLAQFSGVSFASGKSFTELMRRPSLTTGDAAAIGRAASIDEVMVVLGMGGPETRRRIHYGGQRTKAVSIFGTTENYAAASSIPIVMGRFFTQAEISHRRRVAVLGQTAFQGLFPRIDPIGKVVRIGGLPYTVIGVLGERPSPGGLNVGVDDFAVIPHSTYQKQFGVRLNRSRRGRMQNTIMTIVPHEGTMRADARREVETIMRIRHGLGLDEENDFDLMTQDTLLRLWDQITSATYLALVSISSIALLVGGIGVMAIMTISVKERTREIGTRRAIGARRREVLWQFLSEAVFLTAVGGVLGVLLGSGLGVGVHYATGFPISLPWWSFALGVGFSGSVGIVFGFFPALRASGLDPIEALRHE